MRSWSPVSRLVLPKCKASDNVVFGNVIPGSKRGRGINQSREGEAIQGVLWGWLFLQESMCSFWKHLKSYIKYSSEPPLEERKEEAFVYRL